MLLTIRKIPEGHSVLSQSVPVSGEKAEGLVTAGDVACKAEIDRLQSQIHLKLTYDCVVRTQCSRCLAPVDCPVSGEFRIVMQEKSRVPARNALPDEEVDLFFTEADDTVDLAPLIYEEILLSLPMKPLCSESCTGIPAGHDQAITVEYEKAVDPRWEALKKLQKKK
ncbi:MAG TPA: DUF177 domain-containing protein [Chitinivibrionales bacterium]|nr:DUF177 domain-containing protein [Chitinivibrionales bacterium]